MELRTGARNLQEVAEAGLLAQEEKHEFTARLAQGVAHFVAHDDIGGLAHLLGEFLGEKRTVLLATLLSGHTSCPGKVDFPEE